MRHGLLGPIVEERGKQLDPRLPRACHLHEAGADLGVRGAAVEHEVVEHEPEPPTPEHGGHLDDGSGRLADGEPVDHDHVVRAEIADLVDDRAVHAGMGAVRMTVRVCGRGGTCGLPWERTAHSWVTAAIGPAASRAAHSSPGQVSAAPARR